MDEYGLGALPPTIDERDWHIDTLYAMSGLDSALPTPAAYRVPAPYPPILNQGSTPRCVAYSAANEQGYFDLRDTGAATYDTAAFFSAIGGTVNGALVRNAFARRLGFGYPVLPGGHPELHKIAAYYAVPLVRAEIEAAIFNFGPVILSVTWPNSWFHPVSGVLPKPDYTVGGHAIEADGYDEAGLWVVNSWGTGWGSSGRARIPWAYIGQVREVWKAVDKIEKPPVAASYRLSIAAGVRSIPVASIRLLGGCISGWTNLPWSGLASSAPCKAPVIKKGCASGSATVAYVTAGAFKGKWVRIGGGLSVRTV